MTGDIFHFIGSSTTDASWIEVILTLYFVVSEILVKIV